MPGPAHHHEKDLDLQVAVLTISNSRNKETDESGAVAKAAFEDAGHSVAVYEVIPDDIEAITRQLDAIDVDVVCTNGGTGLAPTDCTIEAIRPKFEKELPGFGEYFRRLSHEEIGTKAMLSRATAGIVNGTLYFILPGNPGAVELGIEAVILPELTHAAIVSDVV